MKKKDLIGQEKMMEIMKRAFARFFAGGLEQIFVMPDCEQAPVYLCCDDQMQESLYCSCVSLISNADGLFVLSADSLPARGSGYSSLFGQMFRVQFELSDLEVTNDV